VSVKKMHFVHDVNGLNINIYCAISDKNPEIESSSVDWAQLSRLLPEEGDRIQSPKRCF
jgi:hypothetical protein